MDEYLFGIKNSNRDFSDENNWGKNQFNSSFPASLVCYIYSRGKSPIHIVVTKELKTEHVDVSQSVLFGSSKFEDLYFSFEDVFEHYQKYGAEEGKPIPRIDLVIKNNQTKSSLSCLEVKLTALPDNTTCDLPEDEWGSELVIRPDTIVYLSYLLAEKYPNRGELKRHLASLLGRVKDWTSEGDVMPHIDILLLTFNRIILEKLHLQKPYILQPIWRTQGKKAELTNKCLDAFVWSDLGFTRLFVDKIGAGRKDKMSRPIRALVWVIKMLESYANTGKIDHKMVLSSCNYGAQTDKAFAISGKETNKYLKCERLLNPVVSRNELKHIVKNGSNKFLSPERRFDALLFYSEELFK